MARIFSGLMLLIMTGVIGLFPLTLSAEDQYPSKPISAIVPFAAGGSSDLFARVIEKYWSKYCKQPLVIVNKPGAGGLTGVLQVVQSKPDGYTLYFGYGSGNDMVIPQLMKTPYDAFKDLISVAGVSEQAIVIVTGSGSQFKTLKDLIAWSKKENKPITTSVSAKGGSPDITIRAVAKSANVQLTSIPFVGGGVEAATALAGGHVLMSANTVSEVLPHVKGGRFIPLAISAAKRDPVFPKVPTLKELGYNIVVNGSVKGIAAPVGTPKEVTAYLDDIFKKMCKDPEFNKTMLDMGQPVTYQNGPAFEKYLRGVYANYGKLIKDLDIKLE